MAISNHELDKSKELLLINFKTYETSIGKAALNLARQVEKAAEESDNGISVGIAAQPSDTGPWYRSGGAAWPWLRSEAKS